jgi:hypothetical protein
MISVSDYSSDDKPIDQLNPKKKVFETIQPGMSIFSICIPFF